MKDVWTGQHCSMTGETESQHCSMTGETESQHCSMTGEEWKIDYI
jgi:hypothetical protein